MFKFINNINRAECLHLILQINIQKDAPNRLFHRLLFLHRNYVGVNYWPSIILGVLDKRGDFFSVQIWQKLKHLVSLLGTSTNPIKSATSSFGILPTLPPNCSGGNSATRFVRRSWFGLISAKASEAGSWGSMASILAYYFLFN